MAKGDHIRVFRTLYTHHGIDMGDGTIIHFSGYPGNEKDAKVEIVRFEDFSKGDFISRVKEPTSFSPEEIINREIEYLGKTFRDKPYNLIDNNCEHFATYCVTGHAISRQVEAAFDYDFD